MARTSFTASLAPSSNNVQNTDVVHSAKEQDTISLYSVRDESNKDKPFAHDITIVGAKGESIKVRAVFDDGAMVAAMCEATFNRIQHKLDGWTASECRLRMANGAMVKSRVRWKGTISIKGVSIKGEFEVFDSNGGWTFLLGKPQLRKFRASHNYETDEVIVRGKEGSRTLHNAGTTSASESTVTEEKCRTDVGDWRAPSRGVSTALTKYKMDKNTHTNNVSVCYVDTNSEGPFEDPGTEIYMDSGKEDVPASVFMRSTNPFNPKRVARILNEVTIGTDLTNAECEQVQNLVASYRIPMDRKYRTKVNQRPLTPPQMKYFHTRIDELIEAGVIEQIHPRDVKCASPTTLAQKAHDSGGLTLTELQHRVNEQFIEAGVSTPFKLPERTESTPVPKTSESPKWRICQNFGEINKLTEIAPMPQGNIRAKQQRLVGHRWVSIFDFAAGFYTITVAPECRPYIAFFVEGRRYFCYAKMPFGLTGAPSEFAHMTATRLHDLIAKQTIEPFVDDGGTAANKFEVMMSKLTQIFECICITGLLLSASKTELFMTEATFAGATVGPKGVQPDTSKLTATVNWERPKDALNLVGFLGLTGWFRDLI